MLNKFIVIFQSDSYFTHRIYNNFIPIKKLILNNKQVIIITLYTT